MHHAYHKIGVSTVFDLQQGGTKKTACHAVILQGLDHLNIHKLLKQHKDVLRPAFLSDHQATLTSDTLIDLISTPRPSHEISAKIYDWFVEYIRQSHTRQASLQQILLLCTG